MTSELKLEIVPTRQRFAIPKEVAVCPYCEGDVPLFAECSAWTQCDDGTWMASSIELDCRNAPEGEEGLEGKALRLARLELNAFYDRHAYMPHVFWLPVQQRVETWINSKYRFDMGK